MIIIIIIIICVVLFNSGVTLHIFHYLSGATYMSSSEY